MGCPICGKMYCDHSPKDRGQTEEEMMADFYSMSVKEYRKETQMAAPTQKKKKIRSSAK